MHLNPLAIELNSWCSLLNYSFKRQERKKREGKRKRKKERTKGKAKKQWDLANVYVIGWCICCFMWRQRVQCVFRKWYTEGKALQSNLLPNTFVGFSILNTLCPFCGKNVAHPSDLTLWRVNYLLGWYIGYMHWTGEIRFYWFLTFLQSPVVKD